MNTYEIKLLSHEKIAEGSMAFRFTKPPSFTFKPGQAIELILPDQQGVAENLRHAFSIVSAPFQDDLVIAMRMRDSMYKRTLKALPVGATVRIEGPFGSLTLHNNRSRPAVFIVGGIGITPCMSILRQVAKEQLPQHLVLMYSNRRPEDAAYLDELLALEAQSTHFRLVATMTQMDKSSRTWTGHRGLIDQDLLHQVTDELSAPLFYLIGPPEMVEAIRQTLNATGINDDDIRTEEFYGY